MQIHALTGAGEIYVAFNYVLCTAHEYFLIRVVRYSYKKLQRFFLCSWRDTVIGDHAKIDNLVQVLFDSLHF